MRRRFVLYMVMLLGCHICFTLHFKHLSSRLLQGHAAGSQCVALLQVVDLKPQWPKGYSRVGAAAIGLGDTEKAKAAYEKGAPFTPPCAYHWLSHIKAPSQGFAHVRHVRSFAPSKQ